MMTHLNGNISLPTLTIAAGIVTEAVVAPAQSSHEMLDAIAPHPAQYDELTAGEVTEEYFSDLVAMTDVRIDGGTQARVEINDTIVNEYAEALQEGAKLPPIVLYYEESADTYWLADGFHRFHAHRLIGRVAIQAAVKDGSRRDAVLHAVGANAAHGLRRTNADKRRAVTMLLDDPELAQWSDNQIAKTCSVSNHLVADIRASLTLNSPSEPPAERTYITKHGTSATMQTAKVGKSKPAAAVPAPNTGGLASPADAEPTIATPHPAPEQGKVAVSRLDELLAENAALREQLADLEADLRELLTENEEMGGVLEADDQVKAALVEAARYKALAENAERTLAARSHEFNERTRSIIHWKNRAEKAEKLFADARGDAGQLHAENAKLRAENGDLHARLRERVAQLDARTSENETRAAQLGDLVGMLEEARACNDEMREILDANLPLTEIPGQLHQARELAEMWDRRVVDAPRRHADAQCEQDEVTHAAEGELSVYVEHYAELTRTEPIEYQPSAAHGIEPEMAEGEYGVAPDVTEMPGDDQLEVQSCSQ